MIIRLKIWCLLLYQLIAPISINVVASQNTESNANYLFQSQCFKNWKDFSLFSDHIKCNFQDNFCDWICKPSEGNFSFQRRTPNILNDYDGQQIQSSTKVQDTFALIRPSSPQNEGRIAEIHSQSPVSEAGCMTFWFDFQVRLLFGTGSQNVKSLVLKLKRQYMKSKIENFFSNMKKEC